MKIFAATVGYTTFLASALAFSPTIQRWSQPVRVAATTTTTTRSSSTRLAALVQEMQVGSKRVSCFDSDYSGAIVDTVVATAQAAIASKGSFSLAIPGGSVVTALSGLSPQDFDMTKVHVFFCNERIGANKCYKGALEAFVTNCGIPLEQVYQVPELDPDDAAAAYEAMMRNCPAVDVASATAPPSFDLILLGTGDDGHCGSLYPQSDEIKATGSGATVLAIDEGDKKSIAVSMDFMNAAKKVLVSAAEPKRAEMVKRALSGDFEEWGCPAGLVDCAGETLWFVDTDSIAAYSATIAA